MAPLDHVLQIFWLFCAGLAAGKDPTYRPCLRNLKQTMVKADCIPPPLGSKTNRSGPIFLMSKARAHGSVSVDERKRRGIAKGWT
jgi:hypothetical protein